MSDIAKKTLPPGSWPGSKGARTGDDASEAAAREPRSAPRSAAPPSSAKDEHFENASHYTHEGEKPLGDIQEESSSHLKNVEPQPMSNGFTEDVPDAHSAAKTADDAPATEHTQEASDQQNEEPEGIAAQTVAPQDSISSVGEAKTEEPATEPEAGTELQEPQGTQAGETLPEASSELQEPQGTHDEKALPEASSEVQEPQGTNVEEATKAPSELQDQGTHVEPETGDAEDLAQTKDGETLPEDLQQDQAEVPEAETEAPGVQTEAQDFQTEAQDLQTEAQEAPTEAQEAQTESQEAPLDFSVLKDGIVNKGGLVILDGRPVGRVTEGDVKDLINKRADANGVIWNDRGESIGRCEPLSDKEKDELTKESAPFESFPGNTITSEGMVEFEGQAIGIVVEGDVKQLRGKTCDPDGEVLDRSGNVIGRCERWEPEPEAEPEPEPETDLSALDGGVVTRAGYIEKDGRIVGKVVGDFSQLVGRKVGSNGQIWNDRGEPVGQCELLSDKERDEVNEEDAPFSSFPDAVVGADGWVFSGEDIIGKVTSGDAKALRGKSVQGDGRIADKFGRDLGFAERWEPEPEAEPEATDYSSLAGKRVNRNGWLVDSSGSIYGRVVDGDVKGLVGRMANAKGEILSESGDVLGHAELVGEGEREGLKEGPFAGLSNLTVAKDGSVVTASNDIVGRLVEGDAHKLVGRAVGEDGSVLDSNGNAIGLAERWTPEEEEKTKHALSGCRVNKSGEIYDSNGNLRGKLTSGNLQICAGLVVDDDGDVVDGKNTVVGHVSLIEDIEEEGPDLDEEEKKRQEEEDKKLAIQMAACIESCLDKVKPVCRMITEKLDTADRQRQNDEEVDEEELVKQTRPLIEEATGILREAEGVIKGADPDGRISGRAKHRTASREATPEEYRLGDLLKELLVEVNGTIENAKKKLEGLPRAKKELNPLLGLLGEPLGQIVAGVGLLLTGVLNLVGRLLNGLGLGGILDGLLGTLGLNRVLDGLGLGAITGSKDKGKKKKGGLLGGLLG